MAGAVVEAATQVASGATQQDPLLVGLAWIVGIVTLLIAIGKPIKDYLRGEKRATGEDRVEDAKSTAETILYNHLAEQVRQYREIADRAFNERNSLVERVAALEAKTVILDDTKAALERLKLKLEDKDAKLEAKDAEIRRLLEQSAEERRQFLHILTIKDSEIAKRDERITALEQRQRELELRLAKDEATMNMPTCPFQNAHIAQTVIDVPIIPVPEAKE